MNNLVYLIIRYLHQENIEFTQQFLGADGVDVIRWKDKINTEYELTVCENTVRYSVHWDGKLQDSGELKTFKDFRFFLLS